MITIFEKARLKYKPDVIRYLFIAEAPPKINSNRFFYFENVDKQDSLFLETVKCFYPEVVKNIDTPTIRKNKAKFLEKLRMDGFYLIDSIDEPFEQKLTPKQKEKIMSHEQSHLLAKVNSLCASETKIVLVAATVFNSNYKYLIENGVNVINKSMIEFPGSGGQKKFKEKINKLLK